MSKRLPDREAFHSALIKASKCSKVGSLSYEEYVQSSLSIVRVEMVSGVTSNGREVMMNGLLLIVSAEVTEIRIWVTIVSMLNSGVKFWTDDRLKLCEKGWSIKLEEVFTLGLPHPGLGFRSGSGGGLQAVRRYAPPRQPRRAHHTQCFLYKRHMHRSAKLEIFKYHRVSK